MRQKQLFSWRTAVRLMFLALFIGVIAIGKFQLWLIVYAAGVIASLFLGRLYCGHACPMHTVMRPVSAWSRKVGIQRKHVPRWLADHRTAYLMLALTVVTMLLAKRFMGVQLPVLPILFVLSVIVTIFLPDEVWHKALCPYSVLLRIGARFSRFSHAVDSHACTRTHKCLRVCPAGAITMDGAQKTARIDRSLCLQCELCSDICPRSAIAFGRLEKL